MAKKGHFIAQQNQIATFYNDNLTLYKPAFD
jgi:hypothetical protein